jgi:hypothetical protein
MAASGDPLRQAFWHVGIKQETQAASLGAHEDGMIHLCGGMFEACADVGLFEKHVVSQICGWLTPAASMSSTSFTRSR